MHLEYENKKSIDSILQMSNDIAANSSIVLEDTSLFFMGDNFKSLSLILPKYEGKIDLIYIDPPFNTLQDFSIDGDRANTISKTKNATTAYSDNRILEDYLEFLRERLVLLHKLLSEHGSIYLHIDYKVGHYVKIIMDEIFGEKNFKNDIARIKSNPKNFYRKAYGNEKDLILFYAKNYNKNIWNDIKTPLEKEDVERLFKKKEPDGRRYTTIPLHAPGETNGVTGQPWRGMPVPTGRHWRTNPTEFDRLDELGRIEWSSKGNPRIKKYADEHQGKKIQDIWNFKDPQKPFYPTEKNHDLIKQIILQSSTENSIVLDCFAGSGSTLLCATQLNRKWIGMDNSPLSLNVVKNRDLSDYTIIDLT